jgi:Family of unknown function (DUF5670)
MIWTLLAVLVVLWLFGLVSGAVGNLIHLLLVAAVIVFVFQFITGRRAV